MILVSDRVLCEEKFKTEERKTRGKYRGLKLFAMSVGQWAPNEEAARDEAEGEHGEARGESLD